jgi:hypothetical protein
MHARALLCLAALASLAGCTAGPPGTEPGSSIDEALALARDWHPEARLVQVMSGSLWARTDGSLIGPDTVGTPPGALDGRPDAVTYSFQSPPFSQGGDGDYYGVTVAEGRVTLHGPTPQITRNMITFAWHPFDTVRMDGDRVVSAAGAPSDAASWTLWASHPRNAPGPVWTVQWFEDGESQVRIVDDATGRAMTPDEFTAWTA